MASNPVLDAALEEARQKLPMDALLRHFTLGEYTDRTRARRLPLYPGDSWDMYR